MTTLRLIPLDDTVVFPGMTVTLPVDTGDEQRVFLVPRHGTEYGSVGVVAEVGERLRLPGRGHGTVLTGLHRGVAGAAHVDANGGLRSTSTSA
jgi:ATP-dependent Lon protease